MSDLITAEDLENAKLHDTFHSEVITGKVGGLSGGADITEATNAATGQVQKTLPAVLADLGFTPAAFDFDTGGTLLADERNLSVLNPSPLGDDNYYAWSGTLPKVIPAGSTPATAGGIGSGAWVITTSALLPQETEGFHDAQRAAAGIAAEEADTETDSQLFRSVTEQAAGRATTYDDGGVADAYVLSLRANQQGPEALFDGLQVSFVTANTGTGIAATVEVASFGAKSIKLIGGTDPVAGQIDGRVNLIYDLASDWFELQAAAVNSVSGGVGLTASPPSGDAVLNLDDTAVTPGSYSSADITVDAQGRIISATDGGGQTVAEISSRTATGTWTITGLTIGVPLIIGLDAGSSTVNILFKVTSGSTVGQAGTQYFKIAAYGNTADSNLPSFQLVPTATEIVITISSWTGTGATLYAFQ